MQLAISNIQGDQCRLDIHLRLIGLRHACLLEVEAEELSQKITRIQAALALTSLKPRAPARVRPAGQQEGLAGILANL